MRLERSAIAALLDRARQEVDAGHLPGAQLALAINGELVVFEALGAADLQTRFYVFSCQKAVTNSVVWALVSDGLVDFGAPVVDYVPGFGTNGKDAITIEQLLILTAGIPTATMPLERSRTSHDRIEVFRGWTLDFEPGTKFQYHAVSAHWVLAEVIEEVTGTPYADFIEKRVTGPLGMGRTVGLPFEDEGPFAIPMIVAGPASPEELRAHFTGPVIPAPLFGQEALNQIITPVWRAAGVPGGGGIMTAANLALFYQALLHDQDGLWNPDVLFDATRIVRCRLPHPWWGVPANRSRGMNIAGDDGFAYTRGLGHLTSPSTFGTGGAFGQISWADPATGISFAYCTNGLDLHDPRVQARTQELTDLAAQCAAVEG